MFQKKYASKNKYIFLLFLIKYVHCTYTTNADSQNESNNFTPSEGNEITDIKEIEKAKTCDCGKHSSECQWSDQENKICTCLQGYAQIGGICSDCYCGSKGTACAFDVNGNKRCTCEVGYAQRNKTCTAICRNDNDCSNRGICRYEEHGDFCNCRKHFAGDFCEINTACQSLNQTCNAIGAKCVYLDWLEKGICECPPTRKYNTKLKVCEDICQLSSCANGMCEVVGNHPICRCFAGYGGRRCDKIIPFIYGDIFNLPTLTVIISILILGLVVLLLFRRSKTARIKVKKEEEAVLILNTGD